MNSLLRGPGGIVDALPQPESHPILLPSDMSPMNPVLLSWDELRELGIRYSREHIRRLEADGKFPRRVRLSPGRIAWMFNEVMAWLNDRAEEREQTSAI